MSGRDIGNGPLCPAFPLPSPVGHGRLYTVDRGGSPDKGYRCMHSDHGGNGRKWDDQTIQEYALTEGDIVSILETTARRIAAGEIDIDTATAQVAKVTKRGQAQVREQLEAATATVQAETASKEEARAEAKAVAAAKPAAEPKAPRAKKEHVEPAEFAAVRDRLGLRNKEVAAALAAAGMGATLSRVTELTHSKGSSRDLFTKYEAALATWREANPAQEETVE